MARKNKSKYALLTVLSLGPRTGYDVQRDIRRTIGHFWTESFGQIYPALRLITSEGLATVESQAQEGKPDRRVYTITDKGREVLREWLKTPPEPPPVRNEMLLKLFVGWEVPTGTLMRHVAGLRDHFSHVLKQYESLERLLKAQQRRNPDAVYWLITLRSGQLYTRARFEWCDETLRTLKKIEKAGRKDRRTTRGRSARMSRLMEMVRENFSSAPKQRT